MKVAFCDCFSGISGDMFLGALVDAGLPVERLQQELTGLNLPESFQISASRVKKGAISATLVHFNMEGNNSATDAADRARTHAHEQGEGAGETGSHAHYLSHSHTVFENHEHSEAHVHREAHVHPPVPDQHPHAHARSMQDIAGLIEASTLTTSIKSKALAIFQRLAQAEGKIHAQPPEDVHFHEVGAVDSILDIVGAVIGLEVLGIERLYASALPWGNGQIETQHGLLPLPAPATLELMRQAHMPVVPTPARKELVTPTGAAILATLATFEQPAMRIHQVGTGAGQRDLPWPNIMRLVVGEMGTGHPHEELVLIETNIDDMAAQGFGQVMGRLFQAGALDVFFTPIFMKKNRPATMLSVITSRANEPDLARIVLEETTTFGMRVQSIGRYEADREIRKVPTSYGEIDVKLKIIDGKAIQAVPEYDQCVQIAQDTGAAFLQVYQAAMLAGRAVLG